MKMRLVVAGLLALLLTSAAGAEPFTTKARQALMIDAGSGAVLFSKQPDQPFPPASLAKLMTMEVVFDALKGGRLTLAQTFVVSENAWRTGGAPSGGSTMFAKVKSQVALGDLIQGVIVQSANDGCIAIAEGMAGSEADFARTMTARARELGLGTSEFRNATGLPAEGQVVTARELVRLALHIWRNYPDLYRIYGQADFTWNKITQRNRNPLLALNIGADGMMTGFTEESGYAIVGSATRDGRRLFLAMSGLASERERSDEARRMLEWGLGSFSVSRLFDEGEVIGEVSVYGGTKTTVALKAGGPVSILVPSKAQEAVTARIVYDGPVMAPVQEGATVGSLKVWVGETLTQEIALHAAEAIETGSIHRRAFDALSELLTGWLRKPVSS